MCTENTMKCLIFILCLLAVIVTVWAETTETEITSVTFNKSEEFLSTSSHVYHMELDLYRNDGSILFSTWEHLQTTDGETTSTVVTISGSHITGFKQLNSTHVILVGYNQHCIKIANRDNNDLQTFAGTCGASGYANGGVGTGKLYYPYSVKVDIRNPGMLIVTDQYNHALRSVDLQTGVLGTILKTSGFSYPREMLWIDSDLFVTNNHYISEVNWYMSGAVTYTRLAGSTSSGSTDGSFSESRFNYPYELMEIGHDLILVADRKNYKLRLMNMNTGRVGPVCIRGESSCTRENRACCGSLFAADLYSLLDIENDVFVGMNRSIYKLSELTGMDTPEYSVCSYNNITKYVVPGKNSTAVRLHCGNTAVLPPGNYQLIKEHNSYNCSYHVNVLVSPVIRTLVFKAEYEVTCSLLNDNAAREVLYSVLQHRRIQLQTICDKNCAMSTRQLPWYACHENLMTVYWPTDQAFPVDVLTLSPALTAQLKERLQANPDLSVEIVILSQINSLVSPRINSEGESIQIALFSSCSDGNLTYNADLDTCA